MKVFHISDTHVGTKTHFNEPILSDVIKEINSDKFDIVIHSGDITQSGKREEYQRASEMIKEISAPLILIPGNHDARSGGINLFERYIASVEGVREIGDAVVISVNSTVPDSDNGRVGMVKFNMLRDALSTYSDKPIKIVVIHHHIIPIPMSGRERNVLSNAGDILDLILRSDVGLVLSGHRHYPNVYEIENTVFINAGTVSSRKTRYGDLNSFNIIEITENKRRIITKRIDGTESLREYPGHEKRIFSNFGEKEFRVAHISNTFFSDTRAFLKNHFRNALDTIKRMDPDLVVHCGGIVRDGIQQDYEVAKKYISKFDMPIVFTPAGRDINYLGYRLFNHYFGPFDQSYSSNGIVFQGISSSQYDSPVGIIGSTERKALINRMKEADEVMKVIFLHHNIIPIPHSREKGLLEDSGDLLKEITNSNIDLVLTGTSSHPYAARVENTIIVNANSVSSIYQRSLFGNSFNLIDIYEGAIAVFEINSLWGKRRLLGIWERKEKLNI